jgi:peptidoglycan/LPS O-acetylase OafA/YrhL
MPPENLHAALNHMPLVGLAAACIPLLYGLLRREKHVIVAGLLTCLVFAAATPLVMKTGEEAEERFEHGPIATLLDADGEKLLHEHEERAERVVLLVYATGLLALVGLIVIWRKEKLAPWVGGLVLLLCLASAGAVAWVAKAGGEIRHPEFRQAAPDQSASRGPVVNLFSGRRMPS